MRIKRTVNFLKTEALSMEVIFIPAIMVLRPFLKMKGNSQFVSITITDKYYFTSFFYKKSSKIL